MRNPTDKIVPDKIIKHYQDKFRILKNWDIIYEEEPEHEPGYNRYYVKGQCIAVSKTRKAAIYPCPYNVAMHDYVLHEMIHIAYRESLRSRGKKDLTLREKEEMLVQDICKIIKEESK